MAITGHRGTTRSTPQAAGPALRLLMGTALALTAFGAPAQARDTDGASVLQQAAEAEAQQTAAQAEAESQDEDVRIRMDISPDPDSIEGRATTHLRGFLLDVFTVAGDEAISDEERDTRIRALIEAGLAVDYIGERMIGSQTLDEADEADVAEYKEVFREYIIRLYATQLSRIKSVTMHITAAQNAGNRGQVVQTRLMRKADTPVTIFWVLRPGEGDAFEILDIIVEGTSVLQTKREDFRSTVAQSGITGLTAELRKQIDSGDMDVI